MDATTLQQARPQGAPTSQTARETTQSSRSNASSTDNRQQPKAKGKKLPSKSNLKKIAGAKLVNPLDNITKRYPEEAIAGAFKHFEEIARTIVAQQGDTFAKDERTANLYYFVVAYLHRWTGHFAKATAELRRLGMIQESYIDRPLCIIGDKGVGKTLLMLTASTYAEELALWDRWFISTSAQELLNHFRVNSNLDFYTYNAKREQAITGYSFTNSVNSVCLNDLGIELESKQQHYGTDLRSVVEEFLMSRYELYQSRGAMCHVTTNLDLDKLSAEYPPRLVDRLKQYNFIFWRGSSKR